MPSLSLGGLSARPLKFLSRSIKVTGQAGPKDKYRSKGNQSYTKRQRYTGVDSEQMGHSRRWLVLVAAVAYLLAVVWVSTSQLQPVWLRPTEEKLYEEVVDHGMGDAWHIEFYRSSASQGDIDARLSRAGYQWHDGAGGKRCEKGPMWICVNEHCVLQNEKTMTSYSSGKGVIIDVSRHLNLVEQVARRVAARWKSFP